MQRTRKLEVHCEPNFNSDVLELFQSLSVYDGIIDYSSGNVSCFGRFGAIFSLQSNAGKDSNGILISFGGSFSDYKMHNNNGT